MPTYVKMKTKGREPCASVVKVYTFLDLLKTIVAEIDRDRFRDFPSKVSSYFLLLLSLLRMARIQTAFMQTK